MAKKTTKTPKTTKRIIANGDALARVLKTTPKTVSTYVTLGLPRNEDKTFDILEVLKWLVGRKAGSLTELEVLKKTNLSLDGELKEIKLQQARGELTNIEDLNMQWTEAGLALRERLERVCTNHPEVSQAIHDAVEDTLSELGVESGS